MGALSEAFQYHSQLQLNPWNIEMEKLQLAYKRVAPIVILVVMTYYLITSVCSQLLLHSQHPLSIPALGQHGTESGDVDALLHLLGIFATLLMVENRQ